MAVGLRKDIALKTTHQFLSVLFGEDIHAKPGLFVGERYTRGDQQRLSGGELDRARARVGAETIAQTCHQASRSAVVEPRD
jgi:hypothetical protein